MISNKWKVKEVDIANVVSTKVNANQMSKKNFDKLCTNIEKSGFSSMIACYERSEDGKYVIISGNHRYLACVKLGYNKLNILYADESELSHDEIIAVQLSHNSLHGSDDRGILKQLFDEIEDIDYKDFANISADDLKIDDMFIGSIVPVSEHFKVVLILYRRDMKLLSELLEIVKYENETSDMVILADGDTCENEFLDTITQAKKQFEIKSASIAFGKILQLAKQGMVAEVAENDKKRE